MRCPTIFIVGIALIATFTLSGCGPEETPEQKLERLRYNHEIYPVGTTTLYAEDGTPTLLVDLNIANQGTEPLSCLTVLVKVKGVGGVERLSQRVTVPLDDLRPGIGRQQDVRIEGFGLEENDELFVELEPNLAPEVLRGLPEFADVSAD